MAKLLYCYQCHNVVEGWASLHINSPGIIIDETGEPTDRSNVGGDVTLDQQIEIGRAIALGETYIQCTNCNEQIDVEEMKTFGIKCIETTSKHYEIEAPNADESQERVKELWAVDDLPKPYLSEALEFNPISAEEN